MTEKPARIKDLTSYSIERLQVRKKAITDYIRENMKDPIFGLTLVGGLIRVADEDSFADPVEFAKRIEELPKEIKDIAIVLGGLELIICHMNLSLDRANKEIAEGN